MPTIIAQTTTQLSLTDYLGAVKVRWGIGRGNYRVIPGIYSVGSPTANSDVFVTANYKLSFDTLRKNLHGMNAWILVLDTHGVNVWCAAGKGTFGTCELVKRIGVVNLTSLVNHRRVIVPQLGAVGISAHEVKARSGFKVVFGPVRAANINEFVQNGYRATHSMRRVTFPFTERVKLIPVDMLYNKYYLLGIVALVVLVSGLSDGSYSLRNMLTHGALPATNMLLAYLSGIALTPALLPYIPARSFAAKGMLVGIHLSAILFILNRIGTDAFNILGQSLIMVSLASYLAMNFTGSSTYTSLSGVRKEMRVAVPLQIGATVLGLALMLTSRLF